jgi:DNA-binding transcriptional LysR family regulator
MPVHLVHEHIEAGRLKALEIPGNPIHAFAVHVVYQRGRPPGRAGRWLIAELRRLLPECTAAYNAAEEDMRVAAE